MGPLRRDMLSSSDSFSARNSKGGIFQEGVILVSSPLFISLPDPSADGEAVFSMHSSGMEWFSFECIV